MTYEGHSGTRPEEHTMAATNSITTTTTGTIAAGFDRATTEKLVAAYLSQLDRMPKTVESYGYNLRPLLSWMEENHVAAGEMTPAHALAYKAALMKDRKPTTVNALLTTARRLYAWVELSTGYRNPFEGVEGVRVHKTGTSKAKDALTHAQARKVAHHEGTGATGLRDRAMVNLALVCALRTVEVSRLNVGDYRRIGSVATIAITGKGHQEADTIKAVDDGTAALIDEYLRTRGDLDDDMPLFSSASNRNKGGRMTTRAIGGVIKQTMREEGIDDHRLTPHSLRHTSITFVVEAGADLREAQQHARHADPRTTEVYLHINDALKGRCEGMVAAAIA